ncbi:hypothetical protein GN956_G12623 [Arapaima gigas]
MAFSLYACPLTLQMKGFILLLLQHGPAESRSDFHVTQSFQLGGNCVRCMSRHILGRPVSTAVHCNCDRGVLHVEDAGVAGGSVGVLQWIRL